MDYAAWKDIVVTHGRAGVIYRVWDALTTGKLTGDMLGTWTIVDCSAGTAGAVPPFSDAGWTSDLSLPSNSWIVIQSESAWADATKLQVFLGFRDTVGALAGFSGASYNGMYSAMSPIGGWGVAGQFFGAMNTDWRNSSLSLWGTSYGAGNYILGSLVFTKGANGTRAGAFCVTTRSGTGNNWGCYAGGLVAAGGLIDTTTRAAHLYGTASPMSSALYWGNNASQGGKVPTMSLDGWSGAMAGNGQSGDIAIWMWRDRETGSMKEVDTVVIDLARSCEVGHLDQIRTTNMANSEHSGARHAYNSLTFPREATRDGIWV